MGISSHPSPETINLDRIKKAVLGILAITSVGFFARFQSSTKDTDFSSSMGPIDGKNVPKAQITPAATSTHQPTPVPIEALLSQTKTAVEMKGGTTSFVESGPWTKEIFESIKPSIFIIEFKAETGPHAGSVGRGTAVLLNSPDEDFKYILTTDHGNLKNVPPEIWLIRPGIDKQLWSVHPSAAIVPETEDVGDRPVLFTIKKTELSSININLGDGLPWKDNYLPGKDKTTDPIVTLTGYPVVFDSNEEDHFTFNTKKTVLLGSVIDSSRGLATRNGKFILPGENYDGGSGGPLIGLENKDGKKMPVVLGIATQIGSGQSLGHGLKPSQWYTVVQNFAALSSQVASGRTP